MKRNNQIPENYSFCGKSNEKNRKYSISPRNLLNMKIEKKKTNRILPKGGRITPLHDSPSNHTTNFSDIPDIHLEIRL